MDQLQKTPRKRVANFTADEKALLAQLIKKYPLIESKLTDGKSVAKKKSAWGQITHQFNCNANVHKRDTITLKRAWDNMKAFTRKARATERGHYIRTGGGPSAPLPSTEQGAIMNMVEEAAPTMHGEIKNTFDSDGAILSNIQNEEPDLIIETIDILQTAEEEETDSKATEKTIFDDETPKLNIADQNISINEAKVTASRRTNDYIRREAIMRLKLQENKNKMEMQILKTRLETEQINKEAALINLQKAKLELERIKNN